MAQIKSEIVQHIGVISQGEWTRELNLVSWNGRKELYDIRGWKDDRAKCSKGITLNKTELKTLRDLLNNIEL